MKIIRCDNFDREEPGCDDYLVAVVRDAERAKKVAALLNEEHDHPEDDCFYKVVSNDYKLKRFEP